MSLAAALGPLTDEEVCWPLQWDRLDCEVVLELCVEGDPKSKLRHRITRTGHSYTPKQTVKAEDELAWQLRSVLAGRQAEDQPSTFGVQAVFFARTHQRRDVDNMLKLVLDAITKSCTIWVDDAQVSEIAARVSRGNPDDPRTYLRIYRTWTKPVGDYRTCPSCGLQFRTYPSVDTRFCSHACAYADRSVEVTCTHCGKVEKIGRARAKDYLYCSRACRSAASTVELVCVHCSTSYTKPASWAKRSKYCSQTCQVQARKTRLA